MSSIYLNVPGIPVPQGSKRAFGNRLVDANQAKLKPWRATITAIALENLGDGPPLTGPAHVEVRFTFPRPKTHYRTGANAHLLKDTAPEWHTVKPDLDKLVRAVLDGLTDAQIFHDDAQVASVVATKRYGDNPGAYIMVEQVGN